MVGKMLGLTKKISQTQTVSQDVNITKIHLNEWVLSKNELEAIPVPFFKNFCIQDLDNSFESNNRKFKMRSRYDFQILYLL